MIFRDNYHCRSTRGAVLSAISGVFAIILISIAFCTAFTSCGKKEGSGSTETAGDIKASAPSASETGSSAIGDIGEGSQVYNYAMTNRLTGLPVESAELHNQRPVAIMINNIHIACPQIGLRVADTIYECTVEGGITRLMMLVTDYKELPTVGSIRSCREYYLDFAANHDAIYVHIGGSSVAYDNIANRNIEDIDGMRITMFFRDPDRMRNMGYEHSAMTDGELLTNAIAKKGYSTTYAEDSGTSFNFIPYTDDQVATASGSTATDITIPYTSAHKPRYEYDAATGKYLRYQFLGEKHIDGETGEQLSFDNVLVIVCPHEGRNDDLNHINVYTTGTGKGYYFSAGKYIPITWSKADVDSPMKFFDKSGAELKLNCGKTFVNIVKDETFTAMEIK